MKNFAAIVFDLDDTLFPEREFVASGMRAVAEWLEVETGIQKVVILDDFNRLQQTHPGRVYNEWLAEREVAIEASQLVAVYRQHSPSIRPFEGVRELLTELGEQYKLGLISDGYHETQRNKFSALKLAPFFQPSAVVFSDQFGREHWKPAGLPYETSLNALAVLAHQSIYIGDNPTKDFFGARKVGMNSIRLTTRGGVYADIHPTACTHEPDICVTSLSDIPLAIEQLRKE